MIRRSDLTMSDVIAIFSSLRFEAHQAALGPDRRRHHRVELPHRQPVIVDLFGNALNDRLAKTLIRGHHRHPLQPRAHSLRQPNVGDPFQILSDEDLRLACVTHVADHMVLANRLHAFQQRSAKLRARVEAFPLRVQDLRDTAPADGEIRLVEVRLVAQVRPRLIAGSVETLLIHALAAPSVTKYSKSTSVGGRLRNMRSTVILTSPLSGVTRAMCSRPAASMRGNKSR